MARGDFERVDAVLQGRPGFGVVREFGRRRAAEQVLGHAGHRKQHRRAADNPGRGPIGPLRGRAPGDGPPARAECYLRDPNRDATRSVSFGAVEPAVLAWVRMAGNSSV
ncbi:hypothetical protein GCM10009736_28490 [Actinomadura bangladeshensis]